MQYTKDQILQAAKDIFAEFKAEIHLLEKLEPEPDTKFLISKISYISEQLALTKLLNRLNIFEPIE